MLNQYNFDKKPKVSQKKPLFNALILKENVLLKEKKNLHLYQVLCVLQMIYNNWHKIFFDFKNNCTSISLVFEKVRSIYSNNPLNGSKP
jgi:hypothetical protein